MNESECIKNTPYFHYLSKSAFLPFFTLLSDEENKPDIKKYVISFSDKFFGVVFHVSFLFEAAGVKENHVICTFKDLF